MNGIAMSCKMFSFSFAPVGDCTAIFNLVAMATGLFTCLVLGTPLQKSYPMLLITAIFGTIFIIQPQFLFGEKNSTTSQQNQKYIGFLLAFASVFLNMIWYAYIKPIIHFLTFGFWSRIFILFFGLSMMVLSEDTDIFHFTIKQWLLLFLCGILNFLAYNLLVFGSQFADSPNVAPLILLLEVPIVYGAQALILNVSSNWKNYLGVALTINSVIAYLLTKKNMAEVEITAPDLILNLEEERIESIDSIVMKKIRPSVVYYDEEEEQKEIEEGRRGYHYYKDSFERALPS